jgi:lipoyl(octanoyl) transferase
MPTSASDLSSEQPREFYGKSSGCQDPSGISDSDAPPGSLRPAPLPSPRLACHHDAWAQSASDLSAFPALLHRINVTIPCYQVPYAISGGPANMALDEALLEWVADRPDSVYLRTYGWVEPTLTLGYFQCLSEALAEPRWQGVPLVRRATGGGAIWHDHELTYAIVMPAHHARARPCSALYESVHAAIASTLRAQGLNACRRAVISLAPRNAAERPSRRPFLCFTDRDPEDIVVSGFKVVGSAQRRHARAILQHGSLLLKQSDWTPELPGLGELAGVSRDPRFWSGLVQESIARALALPLVTCNLPAAVSRRAVELEEKVYRTTAWTGRR